MIICVCIINSNNGISNENNESNVNINNIMKVIVINEK